MFARFIFLQLLWFRNCCDGQLMRKQLQWLADFQAVTVFSYELFSSCYLNHTVWVIDINIMNQIGLVTDNNNESLCVFVKFIDLYNIRSFIFHVHFVVCLFVNSTRKIIALRTQLENRVGILATVLVGKTTKNEDFDCLITRCDLPEFQPRCMYVWLFFFIPKGVYYTMCTHITYFIFDWWQQQSPNSN